MVLQHQAGSGRIGVVQQSGQEPLHKGLPLQNCVLLSGCIIVYVDTVEITFGVSMWSWGPVIAIRIVLSVGQVCEQRNSFSE